MSRRIPPPPLLVGSVWADCRPGRRAVRVKILGYTHAGLGASHVAVMTTRWLYHVIARKSFRFGICDGARRSNYRLVYDGGERLLPAPGEE